MGKILIVSDSHGSIELLQELKRRHMEEVDAMIHCGDSELSDHDAALEGFITVAGNCDFRGDFPEEAEISLEGKKIVVVHGHRHSVKAHLMGLAYLAEEKNADIICFGHSHELGAEMARNVLYINPGSIRLPRGRKERTYCILELEPNAATLHVHDIDQGELTDLTRKFEWDMS